ncbi:hypothetical protein CGRA01v4_04457 [Colletotrichum graminicola]|nr:hypothetical protein CGRA01v4_04457 [Colletotrichum graminicola]
MVSRLLTPPTSVIRLYRPVLHAAVSPHYCRFSTLHNTHYIRHSLVAPTSIKHQAPSTKENHRATECVQPFNPSPSVSVQPYPPRCRLCRLPTPA